MCVSTPECNHSPSGKELKMPFQIKLNCYLLQEVLFDCCITPNPSQNFYSPLPMFTSGQTLPTLPTR